VKSAKRPDIRLNSHYGLAALSNAFDALELAAGGFRHIVLFRVSAGIGNLVAGGELEEELAESELRKRGLEVLGPKRRREVERTVAEGLARGKTTPKSAPTNTRALQSAAEARFAIVEWWRKAQAIQCHTCRKILGGFYTTALEAGKLTLAESYREIAERSGVCRRTVHTHREHWRAYVRRVKKANKWRAHSRSVWQLGVYANALHLEETPAHPCTTPVGNASSHNSEWCISARPPQTDPARDLWHRWPAGWYMYSALDSGEEPVTASELAALVGVHAGTARRGLRRLEANGMAERQDGRWRALHPQDREAWYHLNERKERHRAERALFKDYREGKIGEWRREERERAGSEEPTEAEDAKAHPEPVRVQPVAVLSQGHLQGGSPCGQPARPEDDGVALPALRAALPARVSLRRPAGDGGVA
jgi:DNA-binding transcriptional regulator YhcF (GntR family)